MEFQLLRELSSHCARPIQSDANKLAGKFVWKSASMCSHVKKQTSLGREGGEVERYSASEDHALVWDGINK